MKSKPAQTMEWVMEFLNNERSSYLFAGIIGLVSASVGLFFFILTNNQSFAIAMLVLGIIEMAVMFPAYHNYQKKIQEKVSSYETNSSEFVAVETASTQNAMKSYFRLKLAYAILILVFVIAMSFMNSQSIFFGISIALIIHLSMAITIDSFGEKFAGKYIKELYFIGGNKEY